MGAMRDLATFVYEKTGDTRLENFPDLPLDDLTQYAATAALEFILKPVVVESTVPTLGLESIEVAQAVSEQTGKPAVFTTKKR